MMLIRRLVRGGVLIPKNDTEAGKVKASRQSQKNRVYADSDSDWYANETYEKR